MRHTLQGSFLHSPSQFSKSGPQRAAYVLTDFNLTHNLSNFLKAEQACETSLRPRHLFAVVQKADSLYFLLSDELIYSLGNLVKLQNIC